MKHIELNYSSLAECYARLREMLEISDLGHKARVVIDIDETSPFVGTWVRFGDECTDEESRHPLNVRNVKLRSEVKKEGEK